MRMFVIIGLATALGSANAQDAAAPKHLISVGTGGPGWSGSSSIAKWDKDKSSIKDDESSEGELSLNYSYILPNRLMIGGMISAENEKTKTNYTTGDKVESESSTSMIGVGIGYNFNEDLYNAWWVSGYVGVGDAKIKETSTFSDPEVTETKGSFTFTTIEFGKRFSFNALGIKNISYSPSLSFTGASYGGDAKDDGLESLSVVSLNIIQFDVLF